MYLYFLSNKIFYIKKTLSNYYCVNTDKFLKLISLALQPCFYYQEVGFFIREIKLTNDLGKMHYKIQISHSVKFGS
jgi:hypothetical protein